MLGFSCKNTLQVVIMVFPPSVSSSIVRTELASFPPFDVETREKVAMEVKERRPYRSLTSRRDTERRYTSSSADSEDGKLNPKSYSSSETLKAFDQDPRLAYGSRVKDVVHHEADEFSRQGERARFHTSDLSPHLSPPCQG